MAATVPIGAAWAELDQAARVRAALAAPERAVAQEGCPGQATAGPAAAVDVAGAAQEKTAADAAGRVAAHPH